MFTSLLGLPRFVPLQTFLLKVMSVNADGSTAILKSVPCEAGSSTEFCMVEVCTYIQIEAGIGQGFSHRRIWLPKLIDLAL